MTDKDPAVDKNVAIPSVRGSLINDKEMTVVVEKNIPIPSPPRNHFNALARRMEIGDSVFLSEPYAIVCARGLKAAMYALGIKGMQRQVEGGVRVWRTQ